MDPDMINLRAKMLARILKFLTTPRLLQERLRLLSVVLRSSA